MTEHKQYIQERAQIDLLTEQGFKIKSVIETLSGATVVFAKNEEDMELSVESLQILTANGRKYFSVLLINQQKSEPIL